LTIGSHPGSAINTITDKVSRFGMIAPSRMATILSAFFHVRKYDRRMLALGEITGAPCP
jgi:hypothetical protein